ncbi:hypothetical protein EYY60_07855 [Flavobacterium zhairuonense]|uniref:hypothetical protein n=1 Tax=Flavobacterium zhairuonense TaxID=2493631 RepID=UPI0010501E5F|nr:hypothetical protein [Flavobacterium zhairuonense]KAF2512154.1 hypothetical protein EYY60_07855 [Flavobacterium zhairuonense]
MQKITCFLILLIIFSCTQKKTEPENKPDSTGFNNTEIQKIAHFYRPEKLSSTYSEKSNFEIKIYNSNVLKKDKENLKLHSDKIAVLLKAHLTKNNITYNDVIVRIYQKNDGEHIFQYNHKELMDIEKRQHLDKPKKNKL